MDGIQAAVLRIKLKGLDHGNAARRAHARSYAERLTGLPGLTVTPPAAYGVPVYHIYAVRVTGRDRVLQALTERGIGCGIHYPIPIHLQQAYRSPGLRVGSCPVGSFFLGSAWARVLHGTYGFSPVYFVLGPVPAMAEARLRANTEASPPASLPSQGSEPVEGLVEQTSRLLHESQAFSALLPMVEVNSWLTGRRGVSLPFTDECEPLSSDVGSFRRVVQAALEYARVRAWKYV